MSYCVPVPTKNNSRSEKHNLKQNLHCHAAKIVKSVRHWGKVLVINDTVDVGVNRTNLSLEYYHCQIIELAKQYNNCFVDVDKLRL